jgi:NAD(P)-dependent dehydrogenase (short-subunit alcohol dehydrogenase family)
MTRRPPASLLAGRVALVTGASRGIGRAIALALASAGADVALAFREREDRARAVAEEIRAMGRAVRLARGDAGRTEDVRRWVAETAEWRGGLDAVVANAGIEGPGPNAEVDLESWRRTLDTNAFGPFALVREAAPHLRARKGAAVLVASTSGLLPSRDYVPYRVSKAGVIMLARSMALSLAPDARANAIAPGWIETDMTVREHSDPAVRERIRGTIPLDRWGRVDDIAHAAVFLLSDLARFVTGQVLVVDGGETLTWTLARESNDEPNAAGEPAK